MKHDEKQKMVEVARGRQEKIPEVIIKKISHHSKM